MAIFNSYVKLPEGTMVYKNLAWAGNANVKTPEESKMRRVPRPSGDPS